jgi:hypothetical protein
MLFWGLVNFEIEEVTDFFLTREEAEAALCEIVADEPAFATVLGIALVNLTARQPSVTPVMSKH